MLMTKMLTYYKVFSSLRDEISLLNKFKNVFTNKFPTVIFSTRFSAVLTFPRKSFVVSQIYRGRDKKFLCLFREGTISVMPRMGLYDRLSLKIVVLRKSTFSNRAKTARVNEKCLLNDSR